MFFCLLSGYAEWNNIKNLKIAVLDLKDRIDDEQIDTITLSELLLIHLVSQNAFQIVERSMLNNILEEQEFQLSELSESELTRIGTLAGANKILSGSISKIGNTYFIIVKGIDTMTGIIDLSDQVSSVNIEDLINVLPILAERLVAKANGKDIAPFAMSKTTISTEKTADIAGEYTINGTNPDGSSYTGSVYITKSNDKYNVKWYIGDQTFEGTGTILGKILTVDWGDIYPVIYTIQTDGILNGTWENGAAKEVLIPVK